MIIEGTKETFASLTKEGVVLVDFFATWCGPCKMLHPVLEELANEKKISIVKVDIDKNEELAVQYGVMSVPTLMLLKEGKRVSVSIGYQDKESLIKWIEENK